MNISEWESYTEWVKFSSGSWDFHINCYLGEALIQKDILLGRPLLAKGIFIQRQHVAEMWVTKNDKDNFGNAVVARVRSDASFFDELLFKAKTSSDALNKYITEAGVVDIQHYRMFLEKYESHYEWHTSVKHIGDYLSQEEFSNHLSALEEVRIYLEPTFTNVKKYLKIVTNTIATRTGYTPELVSCLLHDEIEEYFLKGALPTLDELKIRFNGAALLCVATQCQLYVGEEMNQVQNLTQKQFLKNEIRGQVAYGGKVHGMARVITNPEINTKFNEGEILVAGMTRPEYMPYIVKAAAIVTDAGGLLTHAAITAREMKKPCIVGTQVATKVIHDGDSISVDADRGIVTILEKRS
jgi:phosphohistidine swiveling domain-containing protein